MTGQEELDTEIINLIIARLKSIPHDAQLSIGGDETKTMTQEELIEEVRQQSDIGRKIIESQLFFLRSLNDLPIGNND